MSAIVDQRLDVAPKFPLLGRLDTTYCNDFKERWRERRALLIAQRDIRQAHLTMILPANAGR